MIVVSNTSPLTNLAAIGQFDLLQSLHKSIHIAQGVWDELNHEEKKWPGSYEVSQATWIERHSVENKALVTALENDLDLGESETIALALELQADLVLLDEKEGRRMAKRLELPVMGVVGILLEAKAIKLVDRVLPHLDDLRNKAGFYLSEPLYQSILLTSGETAS